VCLQLEEYGAIVTNNGLTTERSVRSLAFAYEHSQHQISVIGVTGYSEGVHRFTTHIDHLHQNVCWVGVAKSDAVRSGRVAYEGTLSSITNVPAFEQGTVALSTHDVVTIEVDCERKKMHVWLNGIDCGVRSDKTLPDLQPGQKYFPCYYMREPNDGITFVPEPLADSFFNLKQALSSVHGFCKAVVDGEDLPMVLIEAGFSEWYWFVRRTFRESMSSAGLQHTAFTPQQSEVPSTPEDEAERGDVNAWTLGRFIRASCNNLRWTHDRDCDVVRFINHLCEKLQVSPFQLTFADFLGMQDKKVSNSWRLLKSVPIEDVAARFCVLRQINLAVSKVPPHVCVCVCVCV
jgi:hypothetical protein